MPPPTYLANLNSHKRDLHIQFDEGPHIYYIDRDKSYTSVTTWIHSFFTPFNANMIIDKMMQSKKWPKSKYFGKTKEQIKNEWKESGQQASAAGTKLHYDIECFWNKCPNQNNSVEYQYFLNFVKHFPLQPYRTEWTIWDSTHKLAGSIDFISKNDDGTLSIYDWKRSKEIKKYNRFDCAQIECISHLPDSNFWHYTLQLNTYKKIIEDNYDFTIKDMYLVCLHPNQSNFQRIKVPHLKEEMKNLFQLRFNKINDAKI